MFYKPFLEKTFFMTASTKIEINGRAGQCVMWETYDNNLISDSMFFKLGVPLEVNGGTKQKPGMVGPMGERLFTIGRATLLFKLDKVRVQGTFWVVCKVDMDPILNFDVVITRRMAPGFGEDGEKETKYDCCFCKNNHHSSLHHRLKEEKKRAGQIRSLLKL